MESHNNNDSEMKKDNHWRQVFDSSVLGYCLIDKDYNIFDVNTAFASIFGLNKKDILTKKCFEVYNGKLCHSQDCLVKRIFEGEKNPFLAREVVSCNGTKIPCVISARPYLDTHGNITGIIQEVSDISTRSVLSTGFLENLSKFAIYMSQSPDGIFVVNTEGFFVDANSSSCDMLGYTPAELLKLHISDIDVNLKNISQFKAEKPSGEIMEDERVLRKKDGTYIIVHIKSVALGKDMYISYVRDITHRKRTEQSLSALHEQLNSVVNSITDGFYALDNNLRFTYANKKTIESFQRDNLIGKCLWEIIGKDNFQRCRQYFSKALRKRTPVNFEFQFSGQWYETNIYPGDIGLSVYFRDITENKLLQEELSRLERLNLIGQMSAGIGHELRNPMTTVRGFLQMLGNNESDSKKLEYYTVMIEELDRANSIITEFLSLAKNKAVNLQPNSLNVILNTLYPLISTDAIRQDKNVILKKGEIPNIPLDEKEIRQLILNLVNNGLEAMSVGGILTLGTYHENDEVLLYVQDQGCGIDSNILEKVGNPFVTTKENGTGLGLAVCYSVANRHNAKIEIKTSNMGTTFLVRFKLAKHSVKEVS